MKLTDIEQDLAALKTCYELTDTELKHSPVCPHCQFALNENSKNVHGQLDNLENRIDLLVDEWKQKLLETIADPLVQVAKKYLSEKQVKVIDDFVSAAALPSKVDDNFINSSSEIRKQYRAYVKEQKEKIRLNEIISEYTQGKDPNTLRIIVKRHGAEE